MACDGGNHFHWVYFVAYQGLEVFPKSYPTIENAGKNLGRLWLAYTEV